MKIPRVYTVIFTVVFFIGCGERFDPYLKNDNVSQEPGGGAPGKPDTPMLPENPGGDAVNGVISVTEPNNGVDLLVIHTPAVPIQFNTQVPESMIAISVSNGIASVSAANDADKNLHIALNADSSVKSCFHEALPIKIEGFPVSTSSNENSVVRSKWTDHTGGLCIPYESKPYPVGSKRRFHEGFDFFTGVSVAESRHAYFLINEADKELNAWVVKNPQKLEKYKNQFDKIYEAIVPKFGPPEDVDGNGKIIVFFSKIDASGFVRASDLYPDKIVVEGPSKYIYCSNKADMLYMNPNLLYSGYIMGTIAHEFQHLLYFSNRLRKTGDNTLNEKDPNYEGDLWFNEALSMLSSHIVWEEGVLNYDPNIGDITKFFTNFPYDKQTLTYFSHKPSSYGYGAFFSQYLYEMLGDKGIKDIYASKYGGIKAIEEAIKNQYGNAYDFNYFFKDFITALYMYASNQDDGNPKHRFNGPQGLPSLFKPYMFWINNNEILNLPLYSFNVFRVKGPVTSIKIEPYDNITAYVYPR